MKQKSVTLYLVLLAFLAACKSGNDKPIMVKTAETAKLLLAGKTWVVKDVGLKSVSTGEAASADAVAADWFSVAKELGDYEKEAQGKFTGATLELKPDGVANTKGFQLTDNQKYVITDEAKEETQPGVRLEITGASEMFKDMGISEATFTYFIVAANEKTVILEAPNQINNRKVVLMLESK